MILIPVLISASLAFNAGVERGEQVAAQMWGPSCAYTISWDDPVPADDGSWAAHAVGDTCHVGFNTLYRDAWFMNDFEWACTAFVHEVGHLTGHPHSDDPHDVMHSPTLYTVPGCELTALARRPIMHVRRSSRTTFLRHASRVWK